MLTDFGRAWSHGVAANQKLTCSKKRILTRFQDVPNGEFGDRKGTPDWEDFVATT
jgi:hypothetical protein